MNIPKVSDVVGIINKFAPFATAEEWDNVGLQVGDSTAPTERIMVSLDPCREAIEAAIHQQCRLLLTHHPFIFKPLKRITLNDHLGSLISHTIKHDLAVVSLHTNLDIAAGGVNDLLARRLGLVSCQPLKVTGTEELVKLAVFVPRGHEERVLDALSRFSSVIGKYRDCSFQAPGTGTFRPLEGAKPFIGEIGTRQQVEEVRLEVLLRNGDLASALNALVKAHPYEEPAFDLYPLLNRGESHGLGRIGELASPISLREFAVAVKERLAAAGVRMVGAADHAVKKVAVCGGSGASLLREAHFRGADLLVTGDVKYHEAREAEDLGIALLDAGHFATERLMVEGVKELLGIELGKKGFTSTVMAYEGEREPFSFI